MSNVLLESCAAGRPIITTDRPGCGEIVDDGVNGFLIPPQEAEPLAEKLKLLINNASLRRQMGKASREKAEREFSLDEVVEKHLNLYNELI